MNKRDELRALHAEVDAAAAALAARHAGRLRCGRGCASCCVDDIRVFEVEAERIRGAHAALLAGGEPHAVGACAFLDAAGACRIYADRPYVCRTQGLPLRWISERDDGSAVELRDICPLNAEGEPVEELPAAACFELGPFEERLRELEARASRGEPRRVALRSLFARSAK